MYDEYCVYESGKNINDDSLNVLTCWHVKPLCSMMLYRLIKLSFDMISIFELEQKFKILKYF